VARPWTIVDFALVWVGGFAGTWLFYGVGTMIGLDEGLIVLGLGGRYLGNLGVLWMLARRRADSTLGLSIEPKDIRYVGLGILIQIASAILIEPLARILFPDGPPPQQIAEIISDPGASVMLKLSLFSAAVLLAPVTEELMFRGVLLRAMEHRGRRIAMVITALVFALVHLLGVDPDRFLASAAVVAPPIFLLGLMLAWLTIREGRLGPAIFLHSGWNLLAALVFLLPGELLESVS